MPGPGRGRVAEREVSPPFPGSVLSLVCVGWGGGWGQEDSTSWTGHCHPTGSTQLVDTQTRDRAGSTPCLRE